MPAGALYSKPGKPGYILRYEPATDSHEAYTPPVPGVGPRGVDVDTKGIVWTALGGSGILPVLTAVAVSKPGGREINALKAGRFGKPPGHNLKVYR